MNMRTLVICLLPLSLNLACVDVSSLNREPAEQRRFVLEAKRDSPAAPEGSQSLRVENFHVASAYVNRSFVYRTEGSEVQSDFYNEFHLAPGDAVSQVIRRWLRDSGLFPAVLATGTRIDADLILEGDVIELYGDYRQEPAAAVCAIQFLLIDSASNELLFQEELRARVEFADPSAASLVTAWNACLAEIAEQLEKVLSTRE